MLTVKANRRTRTIRLPADFDAILAKCDRFMVFISEDSILLVPANKKFFPVETDATGQPMTLDDIDHVGHVHRKKPRSRTT